MAASGKLIGVISPDEVYTKEGLWRCAALGPQSIRDACDSGIVKPLFRGRRVYYLGKEVIAWIVATGNEDPPRSYRRAD